MLRSLPLRTALVAALTVLWTPASASSMAEPRWAATLYGGALTKEDWQVALAAPWAADYEDVGLVGLGLSTVYLRRAMGGWAMFEAGGEVLGARHFGDQRHWELNVAPALVRLRAPSGVAALSFSLGLSMASEVPKAERATQGSSAATMTYWALEAELGPFEVSPWSLAARLHHRSTAYGLFGDEGGSNGFLLGLRRRW